MTPAESAQAVAFLATSYPGATFPEESAAAYEGFLAELDYSEVANAIGSIVCTSKFLPSVAEIRTEVFRTRELARKIETSRLLPLPPQTGPRPEVWGVKLAGMQEHADRYKAMAEAWFKSKGKPYPGDPAKPLIDLCQAGAQGKDVRDGFRRAMPNVEDDSERRFP